MRWPHSCVTTQSAQIRIQKAHFLPRSALHKHGLCDVRPSVRHVCVFCRKEQTYLYNFFTVLWPHRSSFSTPNVMAILQWDPITGASTADEVGKNCNLDQCQAVGQMTGVRSTTHGRRRSSRSHSVSVCCKDRHTSVALVYHRPCSMDDYAKENRAHNFILYALVNLKQK